MPAENENNGTGYQVVLNCAAHEFVDAATTKGQGPKLFHFRCRTFADDEIAELERAARSRSDVCFFFPDAKLWLSDVRVERLDAGWVRIVGRVDPLSED